MKTDKAITCKHSSTFCTQDETHIICKPYKKACEDVVKEGLCTGVHKESEQENPIDTE